ncbi:aminomethyl-transferring glycine dehydrogenase subunit GcvPB [Thiospirillum jenense]|uniref:Probable glycine dehydrogenase (decarboxylating) subunit 2 n=2 Tax=Thiospirillum jenense TaxID=1653858 RepID=A0A839HGR7_9GAMM|nr:aminomethyl-transferring glycine dehydrogenase subunit GcvPB [Thiospirillum jenense]
MLIHDHSRPGRRASTQAPLTALAAAAIADIPATARRRQPPALPEVSELDVVRHYTRLSQRNFAVDSHFYPLGSCTMKYNPRASHTLASLPGFITRHPLAPADHGQGVLACLHDLQEMLANVTGMAAIALSPAAGAQGEFAGVAMIRAYHAARGDAARTEMLVPDAAHGTNPASAIMAGFTVRELPTDAAGDLDLTALRQAVGPHTAGIMLTNPSTLGVFERNIAAIADIVHAAGGLLYYDGANLNAILGHLRPGDMGFDVIHLNLHKTFSTPHGGGGPGAGPVGVAAHLIAYLPVPRVAHDGHAYRWLTEADCPQSIGRLTAFGGNIGIALRAYVYSKLLGANGLKRVAEYATLNANYLMKRLTDAGFQTAYPTRRASHEFIITLKREAQLFGVTAMDFAKRLLDYGYHAPTTYFPLLVPECLLIEPTETESQATLDGFIDAMIAIRHEAEHTPELLKNAPHQLPVKRLDDVRAARQLDLAWRPSE